RPGGRQVVEHRPDVVSAVLVPVQRERVVHDEAAACQVEFVRPLLGQGEGVGKFVQIAHGSSSFGLGQRVVRRSQVLGVDLGGWGRAPGAGGGVVAVGVVARRVVG